MEENNNKLFVIFNCTEIPSVDFSQTLEGSSDVLRKSSDKTQTFVKYQPPQPSSIAALTTKSQEYTEDEILTILNTPEWLPVVTGSIPQ